MPIEPPVHGRICPLCSSLDIKCLGSKHGEFERREFLINQCCGCGFIFVANPSLDFARIYSETYYRGEGADGSVDYLFELEHPEQTIRSYEWRGITEVIGNLRGALDQVRWLDFGCGNGGFVRHLRGLGIDAVGFEEGWIAGEAAKHGIPILSRAELEGSRNCFDVVTAIEVLEHVPAPLAALREIRSVMKPGALFFLTTGNSAPVADVLAWHYLLPEVHCSLFQPRSLGLALRRSGFRVDEGRLTSGWENIYAFKVLKKLGLRRLNPLLRMVPWPLVARILDGKLQLSSHPVGTAV